METMTLDNCGGDFSSKWYCRHYERDSCLIHFECCSEDEWYPCHKCHNEATAFIENTSRMAQEDESARGFQERNDTSSELLTELEEEGSSETNERDKHEDHQEQEQPGILGNTVEQTNAPTATVPPAESSNEDRQDNPETDNNVGVSVERSEESSSRDPSNTTPSPSGKRKTVHLVATASNGTHLQCAACGCKQEISDKCESCGKLFAKYFCNKCKLLIEKEVDAYHCDKCGICRGNKTDHFHCDECNVCMATALRGNHKCFTDRGHDPCAVCYEEVFKGAIILPCFHMIHKECGENLLRFGSRTCPMCRSDIFPNADQKLVKAEDAREQNSTAANLGHPRWLRYICNLPTNILAKISALGPFQQTNSQRSQIV